MTESKKFKGLWTALVTPFLQQKVDYTSLGKLIQHQLNNGVEGFVVHGTTGESVTTTAQEKAEVFRFIKKEVPAGFPLIVGSGSNNTIQSVEDSKRAQDWGADGLLLVVPYYNKPPQRGLIAHFKTIADSVQIPSLLYNVPGRTITALDLQSIYELSLHPRIVGIKEASGHVEFAKKIREKCGERFLLLSGDDGTYDEFLKAGGHGVISVASHVIPKVMKTGQVAPYRPLIDFLFVEANPIPVKMALKMMGILQSAELRLPLVEMRPADSEQLQALLRKYDL